MISPKEFVRSWRASGLVTYEVAAVQMSAIPQVSKSFLIEAGLPCVYLSSHVNYTALRHLPVLNDTCTKSLSFPVGCAHYRVFCEVKSTLLNDTKDVLGYYCLDENNNGQVVQVFSDGTGYMQKGFLNSSIPQFAEFLLILSDYYAWLKRRYQEEEQFDLILTSKECEVKSMEVNRKLRDIDPDAFVASKGNSASTWQKYISGFESQIAWSP